MALDPDTQIRETIVHFFETFSRVGSACQTVKVFRNEGLNFPSRRTGGRTTLLEWDDRIPSFDEVHREARKAGKFCKDLLHERVAA